MTGRLRVAVLDDWQRGGRLGGLEPAVGNGRRPVLPACARNLPSEHQRVRRGLWQAPCGVQLTGKRLGVVGLGRIGSEVAALAAPSAWTSSPGART